MQTTGLTFVRLLQGLLVLLAAGYPVWSMAADPGDEPRAVGTRETSRESRLPPSREDWYRIEFSGQPAGYELVSVTPVKRNELPEFVSASVTTTDGWLRRVRETHLRLQRFSRVISLSARLKTIETVRGQLLAWELNRSAADGTILERSGYWDAKRSQLVMTEGSGPRAKTTRIPADDIPASPVISGWVVAALAGSKDEVITSVLFPETGAVAEIQLSRTGSSSLPGADGDQIPVKHYVWQPRGRNDLQTEADVDGEGTVIEIRQPLLGQTLSLIRTTPEIALGFRNQEALDLQIQTLLPVIGSIPETFPEAGVRLKLVRRSGDLLLLPNADFQQVEEVEAESLVVRLLRPEWDDDQTERASRARSTSGLTKFLSASCWIECENPEMRRMALIATGTAATDREKSLRLQQHVWKKMRFSPFSTQLIPATTIARKLEGDCTEHAVLLCTLLRSQGIPSRVAAGFVYVVEGPAFAPHMWVEALVDGVWMPLDSTRGDREPVPGYLKVSESALSDDASGAASLFAPLLDFAGRVTVEVLPD